MKKNLVIFWDVIKDEVGFLAVAVLFVAALFVIAIVAERALKKRNLVKQVEPTERLVLVAMFSALAGVLMYLKFPIPIAPSFYEIDLSEVPIMICAYMLGPVAGVTAEVIKILVKLVLMGTSTAYVGDFANFIIGCAFVIPAYVVFRKKHTLRSQVISMVAGTVTMTVVGCFVNAYVLLPAFAKLYGGMPVSALIAMGTAVNGLVTNMFTFVIFAVAPVNILKGILIGIITIPVYKNVTKLTKI